MDRLERDFSDHIDFFELDIDLPNAQVYLDEYAIRTRSTYVLLNSAGEEVKRWSGPLSGDFMVTELDSLLETVE